MTFDWWVGGYRVDEEGGGVRKESVIDSPNSPSDTVQRRDYVVISSHL